MTATRDALPASPRLCVRNLRVRFGSARVLEDVSFEVGAGEILGLAGRNGVGKTTALSAIAGAVPVVDRASVEFGGVQLPRSQSEIARMGICWVPEGRAIIGPLTTLENLRYGALAVGKPAGKDQIDRVIDLFPALGGLLHRPGGTLSGGQQQLLAIARGVMANPRILMIDEMSLGLSPRAMALASESIVRLRSEGIGLLVVDQNVRSLTRVCDRLVVLTDGVSAEVDMNDTAALDALPSLYF
jgi:ABC-type branched-subunit amino acid transport system ATPase component